ncbi:unnamed protein product [Orchesella dallaii]|uniref:Uncharacterized protein n=1 Tax=Orchesella dallaii TaxID=48710 RepID=A0ABP1R6B0_9HEXA
MDNNLPAEGHSGEEPRHLVENEGLSSADPIFQRESDPLPRGANQTAHQCEPSSSKSEGDKIKAKIKSIMLQLLPVPLIYVVYCEENLARPDVMYNRQRRVAVQDAGAAIKAQSRHVHRMGYQPCWVLIERRFLVWMKVESQNLRKRRHLVHHWSM